MSVVAACAGAGGLQAENSRLVAELVALREQALPHPAAAAAAAGEEELAALREERGALLDYVSQLEEESGLWKCSTCTFLSRNGRGVAKGSAACEMCGAAAPSSGAAVGRQDERRRQQQQQRLPMSASVAQDSVGIVGLPGT
eukprot:COSAG01_NODE_14111_length_1495_cov_1.188395_2_plen_142_part_00